eukprot:CAMPEP_0181232464 /NCGR_PEP_ID=MMETSP1096-20121128/35746_1 /TAXON_ID=156174 ORGANISM="Chrysochromulina ericina, Strain CCMP281" /NCGR_SAMPLE_ID=MMETSP1096 /ASSEMBLY_ACC=CAM_ASM_000453 /LENGTH=65 /DNA_ID=CAMNT_0023326759 /DNA_START=10 /DNA_END=207 /DNA_ORIENTATION=+
MTHIGGAKHPSTSTLSTVGGRFGLLAGRRARGTAVLHTEQGQPGANATRRPLVGWEPLPTSISTS